jgi:CPA1 family monovalent cation:H+ antiporter
MSEAQGAHEAVAAIAFAATGVTVLLGTASLLMPAARRIAIPYTVLVAVFGASVGLLLAFAPAMGGPFAEAAALISQAELPSEALLYLFLPPLLFAAGLQVDLRRLMDDIWPVVVLAVVAVVLCCGLVGVALFPFMASDGRAVLDAEWHELMILALLAGAVVAPTDTAAILSIFKDIGAPRRLSTIVEGESLFNDAAAIALVGVLIVALAGDTSGGVGGGIWEFVRQLGGGLLFGFFAGRVAAGIAQFARGFVVAETTITLTLAYVAFTVAQLVFGVSGIIAVVAAAVAFGARARTRLTPGTWDTLTGLWKQLDFWAVTLIFVFAAMEAPAALGSLRWSDLAALGAMYAAAFVARAIVVFGVMPLLSALKLSEPFSLAYRTALAWGGIRGAVTVVLALYVTESASVVAAGEENARLILVLSFGYVLLTLFINAPTLRLLMKALRLDALDPREQLVRDRVMALSRARVEQQTLRIAKELGVDRPAPTDHVSSDTSLSHEERVQVGLLALVNREAELVMRGLERGLVDREIAETMLAQTGRMFDLARTGGPQGYEEGFNRNHRMTGRFRLALWLHRRLGWSRPLASEIAMRFEQMIARERIVNQLEVFARDHLPLVIGGSASDEVHQIISRRMKMLKGAMSALDRQYPAYGAMVRELLVERLALSFEEGEYRVQRQQALISEEVYEDLEADRMSRVRSLSARPSLDLGLEITSMLARVPLFAGMTDEGLTAVAKLLRPELAVQNETIIRKGTIGREMYFVVSGAVEVVLPAGRVKLGEGDFFGEVALLTSRPRNADIMAVSYCELLVLRKRDLDALMNAQPELREQMEARAMSRIGAAAG